MIRRVGLVLMVAVGLALGCGGDDRNPMLLDTDARTDSCGDGFVGPSERCDPSSQNYTCPADSTDCGDCPRGLVDCNGNCIDPMTNASFCGATGNCTDENAGAQCAVGSVCNGAGACELACQDGLINCGGTCVDPQTNRTYCGAQADCTGENIGTSCLAGQICNGAGSCELSCQAGLINCSGTCIDPNTERAFCGAQLDCTGDANDGTACADGEICNGAGSCALSCQAGLIDCGGKCIDPNLDRAFCGAQLDCTGDANDGTVCAAGEVCNGAGSCELSCQAGLINCGGKCIDPDTDRAFCGAQLDCTGDANDGDACLAGQICNGAGSCALSCQDGLIDCGGKCVDPNTDRNFCGAIGNCTGANDGNVCGPGEICDGSGDCALSCQDGLIDCGGKCIDPLTDRDFCGATGDCTGLNDGDDCGAGEICNSGAGCVLSCQPGLINCGGTCTDPLTDRNFCGATGDCLGVNDGDVCDVGQICDGTGNCELSCQDGLIDCGGTCIDPLVNNQYCGAIGNCTGDANDGETCVAGLKCDGAGQCKLSCQAGLIDCGGLCINPNTDRNYCGALGDCTGDANDGEVCAAGQICNGAGSCELSCQSGLIDCSGLCINPQTDDQYCGASGACDSDANDGEVCGPTEDCISSICTAPPPP